MTPLSQTSKQYLILHVSAILTVGLHTLKTDVNKRTVMEDK